MALEVSLVRDSRWLCDDDDVMSGVRLRSVRWRERVGCCEGRLDMVEVLVSLSILTLCAQISDL